MHNYQYESIRINSFFSYSNTVINSRSRSCAELTAGPIQLAVYNISSAVQGLEFSVLCSFVRLLAHSFSCWSFQLCMSKQKPHNCQVFFCAVLFVDEHFDCGIVSRVRSYSVAVSFKEIDLCSGECFCDPLGFGTAFSSCVVPW